MYRKLGRLYESPKASTDEHRKAISLFVTAKNTHNRNTKVWSHCLYCPVVIIFLIHICFQKVDERKTNALAAPILAFRKAFSIEKEKGRSPWD